MDCDEGDGDRNRPRFAGKTPCGDNRGLAVAARRLFTIRFRRAITVASLCAPLFVTGGFWLVHDHPPAALAQTGEKRAPSAAPLERAFHGALPQSVIDMREMILAAVHAGDISMLEDAIEWNEILPDFGPEGQADPIGYWKRTSADGQGREVLAVLANLLALPPARLAIGRDPENAIVYVWPYLSEVLPHALSPAEEVELYRLVPVAEARAMLAAKKWSWWRIAIGADGTWHTFRKYE